MPFGKRQSTGYCGVERRREVREQTDVSARIVLSNGQMTKCSVTDFSRAGAGLSVASAFGFPDTFELHAAGRKYQATVIHRGVARVGLRFV
jgi:hypothetical protein